MTRIPPFTLPFFISSIISSVDHGPQANYMVYGQVVDEEGVYVKGADVLIESAVEKRETMSAADGSFFSDICVNGSYDEIHILATYCRKCGASTVRAHNNHVAVSIVVRKSGL